MGRLKEFKSKIGIAPRPVRSLAMSGEGKRLKVQPGAELYRTARWQELVRKIRTRDKWTCQVSGVLLLGKYPAADSPVVDHKIPHEGDEALFWDEQNLWLVSKGWHDAQKQSLDKRRSR